MNEEILRILKMVEEGKLTSDKAAELIEALKGENETNLVVENNDNKVMKLKVLSNDGDKVNINMPVKVIKNLIKATGKLPTLNAKGMENLDLNAITEAIDSGMVGKIVDINSADGDIIEIVVE